MKISIWKKKLRYRLLLERKPKASRYCGPSEARSITLVKRDNIGDFILSTTFLNPAYARWWDKHITFVCNPQVGRLARAFYPSWQVLSPSDSIYDYRINPFRRTGLKSRMLKWPASDLMLSLRAMRRPEEIAFESWIPSGHKAAIANQYEKYEPGLLRLVPDEHEIYNEIIDAGHCAGGAGICRDILNYRSWLDYCFPESNECNARALPAIPTEFLEDGALIEAVREKTNGLALANYLAVFPFSSDAIRRYPSPLMAQAIAEIAGHHDLPVVIIGGAADAGDADHLLGLLDIRQGKISLAGKLTLEESVLCLARATALLGVDSAGAHVAIAAGVPSVIILGGGHHGQFGPWGPESKTCWVAHKMDCYDCCWNCTQPSPLCIESISPASIIEAFGRIFPGRNNNRVS